MRITETEASKQVIEQITKLTQEVIKLRTERDSERNFRLLFQRRAFEFRHKYHEAMERLCLVGIKQLGDWREPEPPTEQG